MFIQAEDSSFYGKRKKDEDMKSDFALFLSLPILNYWWTVLQNNW